MRKYELVYIISPELDEEKMGAIIEKFNTVITDNDGEVLKTDKWGRRKLAYEIKKKTEGVYVLVNYQGETIVTDELDRLLKINEGILKHMIIKIEE